MSVAEHDCVVLTKDVPNLGLCAGDVGAVIHIHRGGEAFEVEFATLTGQTIAIATVSREQIRAVTRNDVSHVRELAGV